MVLVFSLAWYVGSSRVFSTINSKTVRGITDFAIIIWMCICFPIITYFGMIRQWKIQRHQEQRVDKMLLFVSTSLRWSVVNITSRNNKRRKLLIIVIVIYTLLASICNVWLKMEAFDLMEVLSIYIRLYFLCFTYLTLFQPILYLYEVYSYFEAYGQILGRTADDVYVLHNVLIRSDRANRILNV